MSKGAKTAIIVIVILILGVAAWLIFGNSTDNPEPATNNTKTSETTKQPAVQESPASTEAAATVTYNDNGFSPALSTIKVGQSIKFVNQANQPLQLDSDPHPVHTDEPELNIGVIAKGESKTVTLTKKGTWGFHNHLNSSDEAKVDVQ